MKKEVKEEVGVPKGILDAARNLYDDIKKELFSELKLGQTEYELYFNPDQPYTFGDKTVDTVHIDITLHPIDTDNYGDSNMGIRHRSKLVTTGGTVYHMNANREGYVRLSIDKPVPMDWTAEDVKQSFDKHKVSNVSSISHELMHDYDAFKKPKSRVSHASDYKGKTEFMRLPIKALSRMFFDLYYMDEVENTVRPTELYAKAMEKGITKKNFLSFFREEYSNIMDAMKFSTEDLIDELKSNMDEVNQILSDVQDTELDFNTMSDDEKINYLLRIIYASYSNIIGDTLQELLMTNPIEGFIGLMGNKKGYYLSHMKKIQKHKENPIMFYKDAENYLKRTGKKVIKRMAKVYSILPD